jgi:hypothetical protein
MRSSSPRTLVYQGKLYYLSPVYSELTAIQIVSYDTGDTMALKLIKIRSVHFASRLTGWNAIKSRVDQLGLKMTDDQIKEA